MDLWTEVKNPPIFQKLASGEKLSIGENLQSSAQKSALEYHCLVSFHGTITNTSSMSKAIRGCLRLLLKLAKQTVFAYSLHRISQATRGKWPCRPGATSITKSLLYMVIYRVGHELYDIWDPCWLISLPFRVLSLDLTKGKIFFFKKSEPTIYRVCHELCVFWHTPFLGHMLMNQAVLLRAEQGRWWIWFFEKKLWNFFLVRVRTRYKLSLVFRLSPVCSKFKLKFFVGIQLFGLKTTSPGKPDLKNSFLRPDLPCEVVFRPESVMPAKTSCILGRTWKPGWACTWTWPWPKIQI